MIYFSNPNARLPAIVRSMPEEQATSAPAGEGRVVEKLGDWTERMLLSCGVTKDRYVAAKRIFGLAPTCNCDARKEWLNKVSDWWRGESPQPSPDQRDDNHHNAD